MILCVFRLLIQASYCTIISVRSCTNVIGEVKKHFGWEGLKLAEAQILKPGYRTKHFMTAMFYLRVKDLPVVFVGCLWWYCSGRGIYIRHLWTGPGS